MNPIPYASRKTFETSLFDCRFLKGRSRDPVAERKLGIVLHGKGDSLDAYTDIQREMGLAEFDFLLLNGPTKFSDGFKWINNEPRHHRTLEVVRDLLFALVEELTEFGYKTSNMLWLGHSQGGRVAADLVFHSPETFLGIVAVSSYVGFFDGWANAVEEGHATGAWKTPWLITHGTLDRVIRLREIRQDIRELTRGKIPLTYREFTKGHDFDHDREIPYIREWIRDRAQVSRGLKMIALKTPNRPNETLEHKISEEKIPSPLQAPSELEA